MRRARFLPPRRLPRLLLPAAVLLCACSGARVEPVDTSLASGVDDADELFTGLLDDHVTDGHVDYAALCTDPRLERYLAWLSVTDPESLDGNGALATWINAYNAYTLKLIVDNYPVESINDLHAGGRILAHATRRTAWDKRFVVVGGETFSLNDVEHDIIRKRFDDFRIHFALVCAARSCPPLRDEAYTAARLDAQLEDQGRRFLSQTDKNRFDLDARTAYLSPIFKWYRGDFGETDEDLLRAIAPFVGDAAVRSQLESAPGDWRVEHTHYDWRLND
jgi:hypothetical protein